MLTISSQLYEELAGRLLEKIGRDNYFSGSVEISTDDTECKLTASLVIYRTLLDLPEGAIDAIDDIVPVWWEFATIRNGEDVINDFSFNDLKEFIF